MSAPAAFLALDVGNGSVKWARFRDGRRLDGGRLSKDADFATALPEAARAGAVSVNPPVLERLRAAVPGLGTVPETWPFPLPVAAEGCGADRVLAAAGALARYADADAVLVLDAGTCLTATLADRRDGVVGGAILPGPDLMARALAEGAANLPLVAPGPVAPGPAKNTADALRLGIDAAITGAVSELVRRLARNGDRNAVVVAAGTGAGGLAARCADLIDFVHPFAVLWGLYEAAGRDGAA